MAIRKVNDLDFFVYSRKFMFAKYKNLVILVAKISDLKLE